MRDPGHSHHRSSLLLAAPLIALLVLLLAPGRLLPRTRLTDHAPAIVSRPVTRAPADVASIDSLISARVAEDAFSGVVAVARNGTVVYERAAGIADRAAATPMKIDTQLQIASITKLFTEIGILQLEQAGKLSLTDTVGKFLPDYPNRTVRSKVTVDQLLHHRSGVGSFWNAEFMKRHASIHTVADYVALFDRDSLLFQPGTGEEYSNGGYVILGAIIERASGQSYHDYIRTHVFVPAGMTHTRPYDNRVHPAEAAVGYTSQTFGGPVPMDSRHAGVGPRPGLEKPNASSGAPTAPSGDHPLVLRGPPSNGADAAAPPPGMQLRIMGADGRELSPDEARKAVAEQGRAGAGGRVARHPNSDSEAGTSGPAGDDYTTAGDFIKLAHLLTSHQLLDSARTALVLGPQFQRGGEFRIGGGGPGVNAEFSISPSGYVVVVLSNYDPPAATSVAQFIRASLAPPPTSVH